MSTQYLKVIFPEQRDVLLDRASIGFTNVTLKAESGDYEVTLSGSGYLPVQRRIVIVGATPNRPLIVEFSKAPSPIAGSEALRKTRSKARPQPAETVATEDAIRSRTARSGPGRKKATPREATPPSVKKGASRAKTQSPDDVPGGELHVQGRSAKSSLQDKAAGRKHPTRKKNA